MTTATASPEPPDQPDKLKLSTEKSLKLWGLTQVAHEGIMIDRSHKISERTFQLADMARLGTLATAPPLTDGEDMSVSIGNEYHYYNGPAPTAAVPAPSSSPATVPDAPPAVVPDTASPSVSSIPPAAAGLSTAAKVGIAAAALLGPAGAGAGLTAYMLSQGAAPIAAALDPGSVTGNELHFDK